MCLNFEILVTVAQIKTKIPFCQRELEREREREKERETGVERERERE